ncbi:MAG: hypothetical protein U1A27_05145 [Phycisphaerae bacterium]
MRNLVLIIIVVGTAALAGSGTPARSADYVEIGVVINIQSNAGTPVISTQEALDAVAKASDILKQADIKLVVKKVNSDPTSAPVAAGNADGNSSLTNGEAKSACAAGDSELDSVLGKGQGIKITFADVPLESIPQSPGASVHRVYQTAIIKKRPTTQLTGETIAHELGHILTLGPKHVVTTSPTTIRANDTGHPVSMPGNIMAPSTGPNPGNVRKGTDITGPQAEEMRRKGKQIGRTTSKPTATSPAETQPAGGGAAQDLQQDHAGIQPAGDLNRMSAFHCCGEPLAQLEFSTVTRLDPVQPVQLKFLWLFNTDNNQLTGATVLGVQGVEMGVEILTFSNGVQIITQSQLVDYVHGGSLPLGPADVVDEPFLPQSDDPAFDPGSVVTLQVPYATLALAAPTVPMTLLSQDLIRGGIVSDRTDAGFEVEIEGPEPQLTLLPYQAGPGQPVLFIGAQFSPLQSATVLLDGQVVGASLVTPAGTLNGNFVVPQTPPRHRPYFFVTVVDAAGRAGFSVLHVPGNPCIPGDLNLDGVADLNDHLPFLYVLLHNTLDPAVACAADMNQDGRVDGLDVFDFFRLTAP